MASNPITSWQTDGETMETMTDFIFWCSKTTADGKYSHEIKRCLLLRRKAMTNLDSMLKNRDILRLAAWIGDTVLSLSQEQGVGSSAFRKLRSCHLVPSFYGKQMGKQWKQWQISFWGASKSLQMVTVAMKLKDGCSLEEELWPTWTAY